MRTTTYIFITALGLSLVALPAAAQSASSVYAAAINTCGNPPSGQYTGHIDWPSTNPLWSFDFTRPLYSSGLDGSGLELHNVYYNGHKVFNRAHVPVLNVEYDSGCSCFRDWSDQESPYYADGIRSGAESCFADATAGEVQTTCEFPMGDDTAPNGTPFTGVAVEEFETELILTGHMRAGWYRYRMKWHFYTDGRIWPEYSMASNSDTACSTGAHRHHAYWRFDFDLDGTPNDDVVREINPTAGTEITFTNEDDRTWGNPADGIFWDVRDASTGFGYEIVPSSEDLLVPIDAFSKTDALILRYDASEIDDGGGGCAIQYTSEQNGQSVVNEDIVFWYRSSSFHPAGAANAWQCDIVGPMLNPISVVANDPSSPEELPNGYVLERAYPNPFNPSTTVRFKVAEAQNVTLVLIDALGRQIAELYNGYVSADKYESIRVDGSHLPSGAYTVRMEGETVQGSTRIVLIK